MSLGVCVVRTKEYANFGWNVVESRGRYEGRHLPETPVDRNIYASNHYFEGVCPCCHHLRCRLCRRCYVLIHGYTLLTRSPP